MDGNPAKFRPRYGHIIKSGLAQTLIRFKAMTRSLQKKETKSKPYVPSTDEEKLEAFDLLGDLLLEIQKEKDLMEGIRMSGKTAGE